MTAHSRFPWKQDDPITDELVIEVATCVNHNRMGFQFTPMCFAIITPADGLVFNMCRILDAWDYKKDFREHVAGLPGVPDWFVDLACDVFVHINLPPPPDERPKTKLPTRINLPKVNREYPPL